MRERAPGAISQNLIMTLAGVAKVHGQRWHVVIAVRFASMSVKGLIFRKSAEMPSRRQRAQRPLQFRRPVAALNVVRCETPIRLHSGHSERPWRALKKEEERDPAGVPVNPLS